MQESNMKEQPEDQAEAVAIEEPTLWSDEGWTAKVVKNEDDDGWAVEMYKLGHSEPALVGPWTMGRDKKNPKPLNRNAFYTLVKTAKEFVGRTEQQARARLHREVEVGWAPERTFVHLDIVADEDYPYGILSAFDEAGEQLAKMKVRADYKLNPDTAKAWIESDYKKGALRE